MQDPVIGGQNLFFPADFITYVLRMLEFSLKLSFCCLITGTLREPRLRNLQRISARSGKVR